MTTTTNKGLTDPAKNSLDWDVPLNENFNIIDAALGGTTSIDVTGVTATAVTLTATQYQKMAIAFTGVLTANVTYQVPTNVGGQWIISNAATGAFTITFRTVSAGASVVVPAASRIMAYSNGTDVYLSSSASVAGSNTQIIYNSSGSYAGSNGLTFDGATVTIGGSTATTGASCSGTTATVTFSNGQTIPSGSTVIIAGVTPTEYNGTWVTTGTAAVNQVKFTVPSALGTQTVAGTLSYGTINIGGSPIGSHPTVQTFSASGTWTKPTGATLVLARLVGGGGGGGGGAFSSGPSPSGADGGAGAAVWDTYLTASSLPSTVTVTIGAGGTGGTASTSSATTSGGYGSRTTFGTYAITSQAAPGSPLGPGTAELGAGNGGNGNTSAGGSGSAAILLLAGGGGGGGAGGLSIATGGTGGGNTPRSTSGGTGGSTDGAAGATGAIAAGGGGGASGIAVKGGNGGTGGTVGGGGGGGGGGKVTSGGTGGAGGIGYAEIWSW